MTAIRPDAKHLVKLRLFNQKVEHLEKSGFARRFRDEEPMVIAYGRDLQNVRVDGGIISFEATMQAHVEDFNQDEIDAFVLTYRMFTQNNDGISIGNMTNLYQAEWMPDEARERFEEARQRINECLDGPAVTMFGERKVIMRELVDIVIFGGMAHTNAAKAELFNDWAQSHVAGFLWGEFFGFMRTMLPLLEYLRDLNVAVLAYVERPD